MMRNLVLLLYLLPTFGLLAAATPDGIADPAVAPAGGPVQLAPDGAWTWFNDERSIWHLGKLYTGYVRSDGKVGISRFDPATGTSRHATLSSFTDVNDHNNPSITVLPDDRLLAVYSVHLNNPNFYSRTSLVTEPDSDADWGPEIVHNTGTRVTYANTFRLSAESDRIYLFNRNINFNPTLSLSKDNGKTFGPQTHFIATGAGGTRPYPRYVSNSIDRIDLIYTDGHPRKIDNSVYHLYYKDGTFRRTDGTSLKTLADLPLDHDGGERGTEVYSYSASPWGPEDGPDDWIPNGRAWVWDICYDRNGHPVCVFQVQVDNVTGSGWDHDRIYYYYARWTGTEWQRSFIAHGGRGLYDFEDDYGGGMAVDPENPNVVYVSTNAANPFDLSTIKNVPLNAKERYEIWQGTTNDGGRTFTWEPITQNSDKDNLRPIVPPDHDYDQSVVWLKGIYNKYTDFDTEVIGLFKNQL